MIKRIIYILALLSMPVTTALILIASAVWWMITGKNLLWVVDKVTAWLNSLI